VKSPPQIPVAVFLTRFAPGGTERQMIELIRRLNRTRFRVHVACIHREGAWLARVAGHAASIAEFPIRAFARPGTLVQMLAFARWLRREQIAVVQTCDFYANTFALPAAALAGVPVRIASRRELNPDKTAAQIFLQRQAYRAATKVVANSAAARAMLELEGIARKSIAVIPNGVDADATPARRPELLRRPVRSVITVANLRAEKNHETVIEAAAILAKPYPDVRFLIVGDGPRRRELEALATARNLGGRVMFLGYRDDVPSLLAGADIFVLPSRSEAFPNGAIEAMAAGLPVVASAVGGLLELIDDGRTGMLVPPGDPGQLAAALRRLIDDRSFAAALGSAARTDVRLRYSFDRMVSDFEDLYVAGLPARSLSGVRRTQAAGV
jgi:glycosyltransferase involved in cell wall biosynthesis